MLTINSWWPWAHSPSPPGARGWIKLTPVTPPNYFTISQSENHAQAVHVSCDFPCSLGFYKCFTKLFSSLGLFGHEPPVSLCGPTINLSWLQTPRLQLLCIGHTDMPLTSRWGTKLLNMVYSVRPPPPSLTPAVSTACLLLHTRTEVNFLELHVLSWICAFAHVIFLGMVSTCLFSLTF